MWRKTEEKLVWLRLYFQKNRGVGHTRAMIKGAANVPNVVIMTHTQSFGDDLKHLCWNAKIVTWNEFSPHQIMGMNYPLLIDHRVFFDIISDAFEMLRELKEENAKMVSALRDEKEAAALLGRMTSKKKAKASRENGRKGGRPRTVRKDGKSGTER